MPNVRSGAFAATITVGFCVGLALPAVGQDGLSVTQKQTFNIAKIGGGDLTQTVMIRGADRQKTVTEGKAKLLVFSKDVSGTEVVRLDQGKIYTAEGKKAQYRSRSIAEMRAEMQKAQKDAERAAAGEPQETSDTRMYVVTDGIQKTGQAKSINGFNTQQQVLKMTVMAENTRTKEKSPVFYMTADMWIDPSQKQAHRNTMAFHNAYVTQLGLDPRTMANNPYGKWIGNLYKEMAGIDGYPIMTHIVMEAAGEAQQQGGNAQQGETTPASAANQVGAALGGLMRRASKPKQEPAANPASTPGRTVLFSATTEVQKISTAAPPATEFEVPAS